jgi:hypothetical protein
LFTLLFSFLDSHFRFDSIRVYLLDYGFVAMSRRFSEIFFVSIVFT